MIGGAYDLETRIQSNSINNKAKSEREARRKADQAALKAAGKDAKKQGTKRSLETDEDEKLGSEDTQRFGFDKRAKANPFFHSSMDNSSKGPSSSVSDGGTIEQSPAEAAPMPSAGSAPVKKAPRKKAPVKKVTAASMPSEEISMPATATRQKSRLTKRLIREVDEDTELPASPVKKSKIGSRMKAPMKGKSRAKSAAAGNDEDAEFKVSGARGKVGGNAALSGLSAGSTRTSARRKASTAPAAGTMADAAPVAGSAPHG